MALASDNDHSEAYNNLGVLEARKGRVEMVGYNTVIHYVYNKHRELASFTLLHRAETMVV